MIRHMVFIRFRNNVSDAERADLLSELGALRHRLDGALDFQVRRNQSPEVPVTHGFANMFWFDFRDAGARDVYLEDAEHQALGARLQAGAEGGQDGIFVCDIEL